MAKNKTPNRYWLGKKRPDMTGVNHFAWKGNRVGKVSLHYWVYSRLGKPSKCEHCKTTTAKKFEWANKSHKYKRELSDWIRLCTRCHHKYDGHRKKSWVTRRKKYGATGISKAGYGIAKCFGCGKRFTKHGSTQRYCGDLRKQKGCSWVNRKNAWKRAKK